MFVAIKFFEHINYFFGAISDYCSCDKCALMTAPNDTYVIQPQVYTKTRDVTLFLTFLFLSVECTNGWMTRIERWRYRLHSTSNTSWRTHRKQYVMSQSSRPNMVSNNSWERMTLVLFQYWDGRYWLVSMFYYVVVVFVSGNVFPASFDQTMRKVHKLLLHVIAHLFHAHFKQFVDFNLHAFLNTFALHFLMFARRFALVDNKELEVVDDLYQKLSSASVRVVGKDDSKRFIAWRADIRLLGS